MRKPFYQLFFCVCLILTCSIAYCSYMSLADINDSEALLLEMSEALTQTADIGDDTNYSSSCNDTHDMTFSGGTKCRSIKRYECSVPHKTGRFIKVPIYDADGSFISYREEEEIEYRTEMLDVCRRVSKDNADKDPCQNPKLCSTIGGSVVEGQ